MRFTLLAVLSACAADPLLAEADLAARATSAVCHGGQTLMIAPAAVQAHVNHGDAAGACDTGGGGGGEGGWTPRVAIGNAQGGDAYAPNPSVDSTVWSGDGLATGVSLATGGAIFDVDAADLDGDGHVDLVFAQTGAAGETLVFYGADAGFGASPDLAIPFAGGRSAEIGDLDADGAPDLVLSGDSGSAILWGPTFADSTALATNSLLDAEIADLDGDGHLDVVLAVYGTAGVRAGVSPVLYGDGTRTWPAATALLPTVGAIGVDSGDVDGDGFSDLVFAQWVGDTETFDLPLALYRGSAAGFGALELLPVGGSIEDVGLGDLDDDGYADLVACRFAWMTTGETDLDSSIYRGGPSGLASVSTWELPTKACADVDVADLEGDGDLDIAFANWRTSWFTGTATFSTVTWIYPNDGGFSTATRLELPTDGAQGIRILPE